MKPRTNEITHKIMSSVHSKDTNPEVLLCKALWKRGMRYRKNVSSILGKPDIVFSKVKIAIFVDGDFWHGHNWAIRGYGTFENEMKRYTPYWQEKIKRNRERDFEQTIMLENDGWVVIRVWESEIKKDITSIVDMVERVYRERKKYCGRKKSSSIAKER